MGIGKSIHPITQKGLQTFSHKHRNYRVEGGRICTFCATHICNHQLLQLPCVSLVKCRGHEVDFIILHADI